MLARIQGRLRRWRRRFSRNEWAMRRLRLTHSPEAAGNPGLLLIQIDGLGRTQLERALARGRMPFLRRLIRRQHYQVHTFYSGIPSSTPAVQAELHYGVRCAVPAFSFLDRRSGDIGVMMHPDRAKRMEADLAATAEGLLKDGSSWSNIYTGGATQTESHFCGASIGPGDMWRTGMVRALLTFAFLQFPTLLRLLGLLPLELLLGFYDAVRGVFLQGRSLWREMVFLFARVLVCIGLRELVTLGASIDVARGLPVIHVNFLGYDEQSHRRGPGSAFAHWTLRGIDRAVRRLYIAARRSDSRFYEVWIFSDHGQARASQLRQRVDGGLEALVRRHWQDGESRTLPGMVRNQDRPSPAHWLGGPRSRIRDSRHTAQAQLSIFEKESFAVACMGPVGHIYFAHPLPQDVRHRLATSLVRDGVPGILLLREDGRVDWITARGSHILPDHASVLPHSEELREEVARDLVALCQNRHAGNLVALGFGPGGERVTFAPENGAHAGPAPEEVEGFALLPAWTRLPPGPASFIRPSRLRAAAMRFLGRAPVAADPVDSIAKPRDPLVRLPMRVVTLNAHGCMGIDGRISTRRIARLLDHLDADVIALQELDTGRPRSGGEDQAAELARALGMQHIFYPAVVHHEGHYGHAILSRSPLRFLRHDRLDSGRWIRAEPRGALWVSFTWGEQPVHMIGTHLGLASGERAAQIEHLLEWIGGIPPEEPVILCGDFNFTGRSPQHARLRSQLADVQLAVAGHRALPTFPSQFPVRRLDHIFVSSHFEVMGVRVPRHELAQVASDHLPLVADLRLQLSALAPADGSKSSGLTSARHSPAPV